MTSIQHSFWSLIQKHQIEVPIIQRDYAQGRAGQAEIRNNFLSALHHSLSTNTNLELDFVYGSVKEDTLFPLDGQQRLTTLFLLHWYAMTKDAAAGKESLLRFTYETRISSREFCVALVSKGVQLPSAGTLSAAIEDSNWFFLSWKKDPTIKAMLTMLDAIHRDFNKVERLWDALMLNLITFQYIELEHFGLSDDLYIKMNARGKALTPYENFKAKLEQHIQVNYPDLKREFSKKIDGIWTDLFWVTGGAKDKADFDGDILSFFKVMATIQYTLEGQEDKNFERNFSVLRADASVPFSTYLALDCFSRESIERITKILDLLAVDCNESGIEKSYFTDTFYINEAYYFAAMTALKLSYVDLLIIYGYILYLSEGPVTGKDDPQFIQWMRVVRNLAEGASLMNLNDAREFGRAITSLTSLFTHRHDLLHYLAHAKVSDISGFPGLQVAEEILKAKVLLKGGEWVEEILDIENHEYFKGQIGFLLKFAGITGEESDDIEKFREYSTKAQLIFNYDGLVAFPEFLFERALLSVGDYLLNKSYNQSFLIDSERDISWKRLLRGDHDSKRDYIKVLFDKIKTDVKTDLEKVIADFTDQSDWRYYFIADPDIMDWCGTNKFIRRNGDQHILLLESTKTSGYHKEYYSYALFSKLIKDNPDVLIYNPQRSIDYPKTFSTKTDTHHVSFENGQYKLVVTPESPAIFFDSQEAIITHLKSENIII